MPIRINLLAEQRAAEEARRRDPVKRAIWGGCAAVALVLLWCVQLQFKISGARFELSNVEDQWKLLQPKLLQSSNVLAALGEYERKLNSLEKHSTNRFLWASVLNALQHTSNPQVRVISFSGQSESIAEQQVLIETNIIADLPPKSWLPWAAEPPRPDIPAAAGAALNAITNGAALARFQERLTTAFSVATNTTQFGVQIVAKIGVLKPETVTERISLRIRARDYSSRSGSYVDGFFEGVTNAPFFGGFFGDTNSGVQPESIQPRVDVTDLISPQASYIPFTVSLSFPERIRANE